MLFWGVVNGYFRQKWMKRLQKMLVLYKFLAILPVDNLWKKNGFRAHLHSDRSHVMLNIVRKLVKLVIFYSLCFAILFLGTTVLRFLILRIEWVRTLSQEREAVLVELITAARWALSLAVYGGVLLGLSYSVRREVFAPAAILCVGLLTIGFTFGIGQLIERWEGVPPAKTLAQPLGSPGLILSNNVRPAGTILVLLEGSAKPGGSRVVATPGKPLLYQEKFAGKDLSLLSLPPAPFSDNCPWFLKSLAIDLRLNAENMRRQVNAGWLPFLIYAGTLVFLLCSLMFILKFSAWPLANLFLGCLAFRGILALELFFRTPEMQDIFDSFLQNRLPRAWAVPLIFCGVGLLAQLYSFLVYLVKRQSNYAA